jgi:tetratricopeptide (TPR) repeat protein
MSDELLLDALCLEWEEALEAGRDLAATELCARRDCPHLAERLTREIAKLRCFAAPAPTASGLPKRIGRYRVDRPIGSGGVGDVVRVLDEDFDRPLALKVLQQQFRGRAELEERFLREARLTGQLQHPGIPPVQEKGRLPGPDQRPYFIMKLVKGRNLHQFLRERTLPQDRGGWFLEVFEKVCQTVAYAHDCGVIHRDLKPGNVMVGAFGEVQVMDWGLAKVLRPGAAAEPTPPAPNAEPPSTARHVLAAADEAAASAAGTVQGTASYMAPEQARGEVERLDRACDVFGLGGILCEILTGQPPFAAGSDWDKVRQAMKGDLAETFARLDGCGADLELVALAKRCLAAEAKDRWPDAGAVARAAAAYQENLRERLRRAEVAQAQAEVRTVEERKRRRLHLALAAVLLAVVAAAGVGAVWWVNDRAERQLAAAKAQAEQERQEAERKARQEKLAEAVATVLANEARLREQLLARLADRKQAQLLFSNTAKWQTLLAIRMAVLEQAHKLEAHSEGALPESLVAQLRLQERQWHGDKQDWLFARELDDVRGEASVLVDGKLVSMSAAAAAKYPTVLAKWGWDVFASRPARVGTRIRQSALRYGLVAILDYWAHTTSDPAMGTQLLEIAKHADPNEWADQFRDAKAGAGDKQKLQALAKSIRLEEQSPQVATVLAVRLAEAGEHTAGHELWRRALLVYPSDFWLLMNLALWSKNPVEKLGACRAALAVRPDSAVAYGHLGYALYNHHDLAGALTAYNKAIAINHEFFLAYLGVSLILIEQGDHLEAGKMMEKAMVTNRNADGYTMLGVALAYQGQFATSEAAFQQALTLLPRRSHGQNDRRLHAEALVRRLQDLNGLDQKLDAVLHGDQPSDVTDLLDMAQMCMDYKKHYHAAFRLYSRAFQIRPQLVTGLGEEPYQAGRAAVMAAAGKGRDGAKLRGRQQATLRRQALAWMSGHLAGWESKLKEDPQIAALVRKTLLDWRSDPDLADVCEPEALTNLLPHERQLWQQFWDDVDALIGRAEKIQKAKK